MSTAASTDAVRMSPLIPRLVIPRLAIPRPPELIAHRGNAAEYPENTLPALHSALELGALHVEFDVQLSADRQPVLLHDSSLKRTAGIDRDALQMTLQDLAEVSVNEAQRFQQRFTDVGIPTLTQAVALGDLRSDLAPTCARSCGSRRAPDPDDGGSQDAARVSWLAVAVVTAAAILPMLLFWHFRP